MSSLSLAAAFVLSSVGDWPLSELTKGEEGEGEGLSPGT